MIWTCRTKTKVQEDTEEAAIQGSHTKENWYGGGEKLVLLHTFCAAKEVWSNRTFGE